MLTEDLCVLALLKTGRPIKWEFTRTEEFIGGVSRHPMKVDVKLGAKNDGTLTAIQVRVVSNTGAYGNHGGETLASALGSSIMSYRCPNKKGVGYAVYTNTVPSGAFRGYAAPEMAFPMESAMDGLARKLKMAPLAIRRKNMIRPGDSLHSIWDSPGDVEIGSYGLDQCLDFVESALASGRGLTKPEGDEWLEGSGLAMHVQECAPPTEHRSEAHLSLKGDGTYHLAVGTSEFGNGTITSNRQVAASVLNSAAGTIEIVNADTDSTPYDTGTFASVGTSIGAQAVKQAADALRHNLLDVASRQTSTPVEDCFLSDRTVVCGGRVLPLSELYAATP